MRQIAKTETLLNLVSKGVFMLTSGGESGIRTHDRVAPILVFETSAFVRSAISPRPVLYLMILL